MARTAQLEASISSDLVAGGTEIIELEGEFDLSNSARLERQLSAVFAAEPLAVMVDLRGVRFLDSTALNTLVRGLRSARERGIGFGLIRPNALVWRVFVLTGLSDYFRTYSSLQEALSRP
jgi:anti-sigma B factor antagonist